MSEQAVSSERPSHLNTLLQAGSVSLLVALGFLARRAFYEGYLSALGVDAGLSLSPPVSVASATLGVATLLWSLNTLYMTFSRKAPTGLRELIGNTSGAVFVCSFFYGIKETFGWHIYSVYAVCGMCLLYCAAIWTYPAWSVKEQIGYRAKIEASHLRSLKVQTPSERIVLYPMVEAVGGPFLSTLLALALAVVPFGYYFGRKTAAEKTEWIVVSTSETLVSPATTKWILISREETLL